MRTYKFLSTYEYIIQKSNKVRKSKVYIKLIFIIKFEDLWLMN